ncbi:MAG: GNAT family N-acetyltransferase [Alphaproteobacteria bacterium]|nr:GNAT family N-acetyltransferase [Alphaproteobacteria bacterium]
MTTSSAALSKAQPTIDTLTLSEIPLDADVQAVMALVTKAGVFSDTEIAVAGDLVADALSGEDEYYFVFYHAPDRSLAGYSCYGPICLTKSAYDLYWIAVDPAYRGTGLAEKILKLSHERIAKSGGDQVYAETSSLPYYEPARKFYLKQGYTELVRMKDFYKPGDDKVVFRKDVR